MIQRLRLRQRTHVQEPGAGEGRSSHSCRGDSSAGLSRRGRWLGRRSGLRLLLGDLLAGFPLISEACQKRKR